MIPIIIKDQDEEWWNKACIAIASAIPTGCVPFATDDPDKVFVDAEKKWMVTLGNEDTTRGVMLQYTGSDEIGKEFALALWLTYLNPTWGIGGVGQGRNDQKEFHYVTVDVTFNVSIPKTIDADLLPTISFEIPMEHVIPFIDGAPAPGARLTGYTTSDLITSL